jgi:CHAD domain-containing protein
MSGQLRKTEAGTHGIRRIVRKEIGKALEAIAAAGPLPDDSVHEARKRLKKARAGLRLLRAALGSKLYHEENETLRDAGRPLTDVRDAKVLIDTLDQLAQRFENDVRSDAVERVRQWLLEHQRDVRGRVLASEEPLRSVRDSLEAAKERARYWKLDRGGWSVLGNGLERVYRSARDSLHAVQEDPNVENLHEWRKQTKYFRHQLEMLARLWPTVMDQLADQLHTLGDELGKDHDLAVFRHKLHDEFAQLPDRAPVDMLLPLIDRRRARLQRCARELGCRLFDEPPSSLVNRLHECWRVWRQEPSPAGR